MSRLFDEMPEELKMMLMLGGISPTDFNQKPEEEKFDWENPPRTTDKYETYVPEEVFDKMLEARRLLIEAKELIPSAPDLKYNEHLNAYGRLHALFAGDGVQDALVAVNTFLHTCTDEMTKQVVEAVDDMAKEEKTVPTKAVSKMIGAFMSHKVMEDIFGK